MEKLSKKELLECNGGFSLGLGLLIVAGVAFLIGVIDGYIRPLACH